MITSAKFDFQALFCVLSKNRYPGIECFIIVLSSPEMFALLFLLEEVKTSPDRKIIKRLTSAII